MIQFCEHIFQMGGSTTNYLINMKYIRCIWGWLWMIFRATIPRFSHQFPYDNHFDQLLFFSSFVPETTFLSHDARWRKTRVSTSFMYWRLEVQVLWGWDDLGSLMIRTLSIFPVHQLIWGATSASKKTNTTCLQYPLAENASNGTGIFPTIIYHKI